MVTQELARLRPAFNKGYGHIVMIALSILVVSYEIRQAFQGPILSLGPTYDVEVYSYSLAWLLVGIALLFVGTLRRSRMIRIASLAVMVLTVGKVFLFDASQLQYIYRVISFFGLGLALLAISWFYTKFVFSQRDNGHISG